MANTSRNFDGNNTSNQITTFFHQKIRCSLRSAVSCLHVKICGDGKESKKRGNQPRTHIEEGNLFKAEGFIT